MTLPYFPGIILADGSAAFSDTQAQIHTNQMSTCIHTKKQHTTVHPHEPIEEVRLLYEHSSKLPQPRYSLKAVIYYPVCVCV